MRIDALSLCDQDDISPLIIKRAHRQMGEPSRFNYLMSILTITFRQLWRARRFTVISVRYGRALQRYELG